MAIFSLQYTQIFKMFFYPMTKPQFDAVRLNIVMTPDALFYDNTFIFVLTVFTINSKMFFVTFLILIPKIDTNQF